jgi:hypothetical protein
MKLKKQQFDFSEESELFCTSELQHRDSQTLKYCDPQK